MRLARAAGSTSRRLGRGGGAALPGRVAARLAPGLLEDLNDQLGHGNVTVTGTNGKTTTSHLLGAIATEAGWNPVANRTGSNLERGVLSALMQAAGSRGVIPDAERRIGIYEIDEAALVPLLPRLRPRISVFLNLFRDQLDRYAEVDSVARKWRAVLDAAPVAPALVLCVDDPQVARLADHGRDRVVTFGVDSPEVALPGVEHAADANFCACGALLVYDASYMGHVGIWRCDACGRRRGSPDVVARDVEIRAEGTRFLLELEGTTRPVRLGVTGLYTVYNSLAAAATGMLLGLPIDDLVEQIQSVGPVFGRQERFELQGREVRLLLAKNPIGMNEVVRALRADDQPLHLVMFLNDGIADGRDVSWVYDAEFEQLAGRTASVVASGTRADELALRLHVAGIDPDEVVHGLDTAVARGLASTPPGKRLDLVLTYTAMLHVRDAVARQAGAGQYWKATG